MAFSRPQQRKTNSQCSLYWKFYTEVGRTEISLYWKFYTEVGRTEIGCVWYQEGLRVRCVLKMDSGCYRDRYSVLGTEMGRGW
eukprot:1617426-Rhodomonas_salina.1